MRRALGVKGSTANKIMISSRAVKIWLTYEDTLMWIGAHATPAACSLRRLRGRPPPIPPLQTVTTDQTLLRRRAEGASRNLSHSLPLNYLSRNFLGQKCVPECRVPSAKCQVPSAESSTGSLPLRGRRRGDRGEATSTSSPYKGGVPPSTAPQYRVQSVQSRETSTGGASIHQHSSQRSQGTRRQPRD